MSDDADVRGSAAIPDPYDWTPEEVSVAAAAVKATLRESGIEVDDLTASYVASNVLADVAGVKNGRSADA